MDRGLITAAVLGFVITYNLSKRHHKEDEEEEEEEDENGQES